MKFFQANSLSLLCLFAMTVTGLIMYAGLPETLPTQFSIDGTPGNYLPKLTVIMLLPFAYVVAIVAIHFMIRYSPEQFAMPNSQRAKDIIVFGVGILLTSAHIGILASEGNSDIFQQYFAVGFSCFLIVMGNVIGKTERNFIAGIRLPWTLASEQNWRATHRLAGRLMVISGLLLFVTSFYRSSMAMTLLIGLSWLLIAGVYSFLFFLKHERPTSE